MGIRKLILLSLTLLAFGCSKKTLETEKLSPPASAEPPAAEKPKPTPPAKPQPAEPIATALSRVLCHSNLPQARSFTQISSQMHDHSMSWQGEQFKNLSDFQLIDAEGGTASFFFLSLSEGYWQLYKGQIDFTLTTTVNPALSRITSFPRRTEDQDRLRATDRLYSYAADAIVAPSLDGKRYELTNSNGTRPIVLKPALDFNPTKFVNPLLNSSASKLVVQFDAKSFEPVPRTLQVVDLASGSYHAYPLQPGSLGQLAPLASANDVLYWIEPLDSGKTALLGQSLHKQAPAELIHLFNEPITHSIGIKSVSGSDILAVTNISQGSVEGRGLYQFEIDSQTLKLVSGPQFAAVDGAVVNPADPRMRVLPRNRFGIQVHGGMQEGLWFIGLGSQGGYLLFDQSNQSWRVPVPVDTSNTCFSASIMPELGAP